jgi:hypothetical protein
MEEEITRIKKIITTIDDDKSYSIDVDETICFREFKKILAGAAHLLKNGFRIYHEQQEYTNDYDDNTIQEMFPNLDPIPLRIISNKDVYEFEDELISVRFNINVPCQVHVGKFKMMYCFTCNKSICMDCLGEDHRNHQVVEKADYLAPAQLLMNSIFSNSALYRADSRLSKYMDCVNFRSNLKLNVFDNLRKMINDLEIKFASCLEYFSTCEDETEKNTNENLELLRKFCIECFIKLKNDINTKGIIIDDEIFLTLYRKLKEIEKYKTEIFEENKMKYEKLNTLLAPFTQQVEVISEQLKTTFNTLLNKDIYENFKNEVQENIVEKVQKETVNDFMFRNLGVPRKSLNRMSLNFSTHKKLSNLNNKNVSPLREIKEERRSPFPKVNLSEQRNTNNSGVNFSQGSFSKSKINQQDNTSSNYYNKTEEQNNRVKGLNNNIFTNSNNIVTTTTTTTNVVNTKYSSQQNQISHNMLFQGNLVDELSKAINQNQNQEETVQKKFVGNFLFANPILNTNILAGAFQDESTVNIPVDFKQAFNDKDIQLTAFPQGGAFCNTKNYLYFTGGQETQKGTGKIFLRIDLNVDGKVKMTKMPSMLYSHWNHTMIANDNYIFVIGGYNSNKCEAFNLRTLKWEEMPNLYSNERQRTILTIHDNYLYAFMGYSQFGILDSVERININIKDFGKKNWEVVTITNLSKIDIKFYGAGVYYLNGELYFIAGKKSLGNDDSSYKTDICSFKFNEGEFVSYSTYFEQKLEFIENQFHKVNQNIIANFVGERLASLPLDQLSEIEKNLEQ